MNRAKLVLTYDFKFLMDLYGKIAPRSGLAAKNMINVHGGIIDSGYRGEYLVILMNHSNENFVVKQFDRIAQMIFRNMIRKKFKWCQVRTELS